MSSFKIPWVAFILLLLTYITLGWLLEAFNDPIAAWAIAIAFIVLLSLLLASPWSQLRNDLALLFKSDTRAFFVAVIGAFLSVLIISWFHIFAHGLVAVSAATLFRLDAQTARWSDTQIFWVLTAVSLVGLAIGGVTQTLISW